MTQLTDLISNYIHFTTNVKMEKYVHWAFSIKCANLFDFLFNAFFWLPKFSHLKFFPVKQLEHSLHRSVFRIFFHFTICIVFSAPSRRWKKQYFFSLNSGCQKSIYIIRHAFMLCICWQRCAQKKHFQPKKANIEETQRWFVAGEPWNKQHVLLFTVENLYKLVIFKCKLPWQFQWYSNWMMRAVKPSSFACKYVEMLMSINFISWIKRNQEKKWTENDSTLDTEKSIPKKKRSYMKIGFLPSFYRTE